MKSISIYNHQVIDININPLNIACFGNKTIPYLSIPLDFHLKLLKSEENDGDLTYSIIGINSNFSISSGDTTWLRVSKAELDNLNIGKVSYDQKQTYIFEFKLDKFIIKEIEKNRRKDLKCKQHLFFKILVFKGEVLTNFQDHKLQIDYSIPQSHWIEKILSQIGYLEYFLVELPKGKRTLPDVWKKLEKAEINFSQSDITGLFIKCREIGDLLNNQLKKELGNNSFYFSEKWTRSYQNFTHQCSLPLHIESLKVNSNKYSIREIKILKHDCEQILLRTKAIIKYAEDLLEEKKSDL